MAWIQGLQQEFGDRLMSLLSQHSSLQAALGLCPILWPLSVCWVCAFGSLQMLTQLLSRASLARSTALQAVGAGNATFYEVEQILKSLRGNVHKSLPCPPSWDLPRVVWLHFHLHPFQSSTCKQMIKEEKQKML